MSEITVIAVLSSASILLAGFTRNVHLAITCFLTVYLVWQITNLIVFRHYLSGRKIKHPAHVYGVWSDLFSKLQNHKRERLALKHGHTAMRIALLRCLQIIPDAVLVLDTQMVLIWSNTAAADLLGVKYREHAGIRLDRLISVQELDEHLKDQAFDEYFEILSPVNKSVILSSQIHRTNINKLDRIIIIASDITQAYYSQQSRKDFVANVSHELKTPLTVIKGFLELMSESKQDLGKWAESADSMQSQADRMGKIIDSLLLLSKIEQNKSMDQDEQVNIHDMLLDIVEQASMAYSEKRPFFTQEICRDLYLVGSENYLYTIFSNLIFNAVIHNEAQCRINLSWRTDDEGRAVFIIKDEGEGIPTRHLNRLTERFYRVDRGRAQTTGNSTGLGLAIAKHALQYHQAEMRISSKIGQGTIFSCVFPLDRTVNKSED